MGNQLSLFNNNEVKALIQRAYSYERAFYDRARMSGDENRELPTHSTIPLRDGNRVVGHQTIYFPNYPDSNKRNTVIRKVFRKNKSWCNERLAS